MSNEEYLSVGDAVEVVNDYRDWLNGKRGVISKIIGDRAHIENKNSADGPRYAVVLLGNLRKVEAGQ